MEIDRYVFISKTKVACQRNKCRNKIEFIMQVQKALGKAKGNVVIIPFSL